MKKITNFLNKPPVKRIFGICMTLMIVCCSVLPTCFAAEVTDVSPADAGKQVFDSMHEVLNFTTILSVIAVALGAALAIFLGWWAIRKVSRMVMNAFSKGKVSV